MGSEKKTEPALPPEAGPGLFNHMIELFVNPELERRKARGEEIPGDIYKILVLMHTDWPKARTKINEEVTGKIRADVKGPKEAGAAVYERDIEKIEDYRLSEDEDPDCGYIFAARFGGTWYLKFDCRYNKRKCREHLQAAGEFLKAAESNLRRKLYRPLIDNLFSTVELLAKTLLMITPSAGFKATRTRHPFIRRGFKKRVQVGNYRPEYLDTLLALYKLRDRGRYLNKPLNITHEKAKEMTRIARDFFKYVGKWVTE
jgi:HEPN domain-containing protein